MIRLAFCCLLFVGMPAVALANGFGSENDPGFRSWEAVILVGNTAFSVATLSQSAEVRRGMGVLAIAFGGGSIAMSMSGDSDKPKTIFASGFITVLAGTIALVRGRGPAEEKRVEVRPHVGRESASLMFDVRF